VAFAHLLRDARVHRYGIEIDAYRAEQAQALGIETLQRARWTCAARRRPCRCSS
jgi:hypothetical protein